MSDMAHLGIKVTQDGISQAEASLDKLEKTSRRTEVQVDKLEQAVRASGAQFQDFTQSVTQTAPKLDKLEQEAREASSQVGKFGQGLSKAEQQAEELRRQLDPLNSTVARAGHNSRQGAQSLRGFGSEAQKTSGNLGSLRAVAGQAGYQIQDFVVQVQLGTDAVMALGQQGSQLLGAFGPGGALAGAILAIGSAIYTAFSKTIPSANEDIEDLIEKVDELGRAERAYLQTRIEAKIADLSKAADSAGGSVEAYKEELRRTNMTIKDLGEGAEGLKWLLSNIFVEGEKENAKEYADEIEKQQAIFSGAMREIERYREMLKTLDDGYRRGKDSVKEAEEAFSDLAQELSLQIALIGKTETEQLKLTAAMKLGSGATEAQTASINALIDEYTRLTQASEYASHVKDLNDQLAEQRILFTEGELAAKIFNETSRLGANASQAQKDEIAGVVTELYKLQEANKRRLEDEREAERLSRANTRAIEQFDERLKRMQESTIENPMERLVEQYRNQISELQSLDMSQEEFVAKSTALWETYYTQVTSLAEKAAFDRTQMENAVVQNNLSAVQTSMESMQNFVDEGTAFGKVIFLANQALSAAMVFNQMQAASAAALAPPPLGLGPVAGLPLATSIEAKMIASLGAIAAQTVGGLARVQGGSTPANRDVLVGERGPEVVRFSQPSTIIPTSQLGGGQSGIVINQNISVSGTGDAALAAATKKAARDGARQAVQQVYADFKSNGPIKKVSRLN